MQRLHKKNSTAKNVKNFAKNTKSLAPPLRPLRLSISTNFKTHPTNAGERLRFFSNPKANKKPRQELFAPYPAKAQLLLSPRSRHLPRP